MEWERSRSQLQDRYVSYPWEKKMRESSFANSSSFLSILVLPMASDPSSSRYNSLEDTQARANTWLTSSRNSGVPIVLINVQSEPLLTKVRETREIREFRGRYLLIIIVALYCHRFLEKRLRRL